MPSMLAVAAATAAEKPAAEQLTLKPFVVCPPGKAVKRPADGAQGGHKRPRADEGSAVPAAEPTPPAAAGAGGGEALKLLAEICGRVEAASAARTAAQERLAALEAEAAAAREAAAGTPGAGDEAPAGGGAPLGLGDLEKLRADGQEALEAACRAAKEAEAKALQLAADVERAAKEHEEVLRLRTEELMRQQADAKKKKMTEAESASAAVAAVPTPASADDGAAEQPADSSAEPATPAAVAADAPAAALAAGTEALDPAASADAGEPASKHGEVPKAPDPAASADAGEPASKCGEVPKAPDPAASADAGEPASKCGEVPKAPDPAASADAGEPASKHGEVPKAAEELPGTGAGPLEPAPEHGKASEASLGAAEAGRAPSAAAAPGAYMARRAAARLVVQSTELPEAGGEYKLLPGSGPGGRPAWVQGANAKGKEAVCLYWSEENGHPAWTFGRGLAHPAEGTDGAAPRQGALARSVQVVWTALPEELHSTKWQTGAGSVVPITVMRV